MLQLREIGLDRRKAFFVAANGVHSQQVEVAHLLLHGTLSIGAFGEGGEDAVDLLVHRLAYGIKGTIA